MPSSRAATGARMQFELPGSRGAPGSSPASHNFFDITAPDKELGFTVLGAAARSMWGGGNYSRTAATRTAQASSSSQAGVSTAPSSEPIVADVLRAAAAAEASALALHTDASTNAASTRPQPQQSANGPLNRNQRRRLAKQQQGGQQQHRQQPARAQAASQGRQQGPPSSQPDSQPPMSSAELSARFSHEREGVPNQKLKRATLLPDDEATRLEMLNGVPAPTSYYSLPITASDGRPAIVAIAGDLLGWISAQDVRHPNAGRLLPGMDSGSSSKRAWIPVAPFFVPADASPDNIPWLWDDACDFVRVETLQRSCKPRLLTRRSCFTGLADHGPRPQPATPQRHDPHALGEYSSLPIRDWSCSRAEPAWSATGPGVRPGQAASLWSP